MSFYYIEKCKHVHRVASCWIFLSNIGSQCSCETFKVKDIPVKQSSLQEAWSTTSLLHSIAGLSLIYSAAYKKPHRWPFFFSLPPPWPVTLCEFPRISKSKIVCWHVATDYLVFCQAQSAHRQRLLFQLQNKSTLPLVVLLQ